MDKVLNDYEKWLSKSGRFDSKTIKSMISRIKRIAKSYDILDEYRVDKCDSLITILSYTKNDKKSGLAPKASIKINGDAISGLSSLKQALVNFVEYLKDINYSNKNNISSPKFVGTYDDFLNYMNPKLKNAVNSFCKTERESHSGICEYCQNSVKALDSAHIIERKVIIKTILDNNYRKSSNIYEVDLNDFIVKFRKAHLPIKDHIFFLCKTCHHNLDKTKTLTVEMIKNKRGY